MTAEKLRKEAYETRLTRKSSDGGIDIWLTRIDRKIAVQCKRYAKDSPVTRPDIQKFIGAMITEGAHEGIFITTSSFTDGVKKAATLSVSPIKLMQREDIFAFLEIDAAGAN